MSLVPDLVRQLEDPDPQRRQQAILALGRSANPEALPLLFKVYQNDPEPKLRQLAQKAARYIKSASQEATTAPVSPAPVIPLAAPEFTVEALPEGHRARWHYDKALNDYVRGDHAKAVQELSKALQAEPRLSQDDKVVKLAAQLTGKAPDEALALLQNTKARQQFAQEQPKPPKKPKPARPLRWLLLLLSLVALGGAIVFFITSGALGRYQLAAQLEGWKQNVQRVGNINYYVVVPPGERPAKGWPTLVALHGYGGNGDFALVAFGDFAVREGVLLIAPTFGDYRYPYDQYTLPVLNNIIEQVNQEYGLDPFGAVFYGFSAGGLLSTFYAELYPQWVAGVTVEGAPRIYPPPSSRGLPYNILYGENDSERYVAADSVNQLQSLGYPVHYEIVPGGTHDMTPRGFALVKEMVRTTFKLS